MRPAESTSQTSFNPHVSLLFFHFVIEISEEVADQVIKGARQFTSERHVRDARVRDAVRERDATWINEAVLTIVADYAERLLALREAAESTSRETSEVLEVVDWGIRTFGSYAGLSFNQNFSVRRTCN
jgi:exportin-T